MYLHQVRKYYQWHSREGGGGRGGAQGAGTLPSVVGHKAYVYVKGLADSYLTWPRHCLYTCMQAKLKFKFEYWGVVTFWSIRKSSYYNSGAVNHSLN